MSPRPTTPPAPRALAAALAALLALGAPFTAPAQQGAPPADSVRRLSLDDALGLAIGASPDVAIARAAVDRSQGQRVKARSQFLPQVYGSLSYTRTLRSQYQGLGSTSDSASGPAKCDTFLPDTTAPLDQRVRLLEQALGCSSNGGNIFGDLSKVGFGSENQYSLGLSVTQNLFTGGRISAQLREADAARASAEVGLTAARAQTTLQVAQAYYDAILSDRLLAIARATLAQAETTLVQTRLATQVGDQPEFDLLRAQVTRDNQVPVVIQRRADRDVAYLHLEQLLDLPVSQPLVLTTPLDDTAVDASSRLASLLAAPPDTAVDARAPVRQALETVQSSREAVTVSRSARLPSLTLSSQYGRVAYPANGFPAWDAFRTNWTITGAIQVPLFTGGSIKGDEMMAQAGLRDAEARLRQTRQLAAVDAENTMAQLRTASSRYSASQGTVEQATKAYQIAQVRYREGISTQTELTDSRIALEQAEANRAQAARDLQVARLRVSLLRDLPLSGASAAPAGAQQTTTPAPAQPAASGGTVTAGQVRTNP